MDYTSIDNVLCQAKKTAWDNSQHSSVISKVLQE